MDTSPPPLPPSPAQGSKTIDDVLQHHENGMNYLREQTYVIEEMGKKQPRKGPVYICLVVLIALLVFNVVYQVKKKSASPTADEIAVAVINKMPKSASPTADEIDKIVTAVILKLPKGVPAGSSPSKPSPTADEMAAALIKQLPAKVLAGAPSKEEILGLLKDTVPTVDEIWKKPFTGVNPGDGKRTYFIGEADGRIEWGSEPTTEE